MTTLPCWREKVMVYYITYMGPMQGKENAGFEQYVFGEINDTSYYQHID